MQDREEQILALLQEQHTLSFRRLSQLLFVSEPTVRRAVSRLESSGLVEHVYGGVKLAQYKNDVIPVDLRESANASAKETIARMAAERIHDGDTIFFDSSSTVRRICHYIAGKHDLTVFTNNLRVLAELRDTDVRVFCTGGAYFRERDCFLGAMAERFIESVNADLLFFSCLAVSREGLLTDVSEEEISIRRVMMRHAARKILLCDSSKYDTVRALRLGDVSELDEVICDRPLHFPGQP